MTNDKKNLEIKKKPQEISEEDLKKVGGGQEGDESDQDLSKCNCPR